MSDERRRSGGEKLEVQGPHAIEKSFSCTEGDRGDVGAQLMDQASGQELVDRGSAACDGDVTLTGSGARLVQSRADSIRDERERGSAPAPSTARVDGG